MTLNEQNGRPVGVLMHASIRAATTGRMLGDSRGAAAILDAALAQRPIDSLPAAVRPHVPLALTYGFAGRADRVAELAKSFERSRKGIVEYTDARDRINIAAAEAFAEERWDDAIRGFSAASDSGDCSTCALPWLAMTYDRAGAADSAIATYRRYLDTNDHFRYQVDQFWLGPSLRRLGELYEQKGDIPNAVKYYREFVDLWRRADPELQPRVAEARRRISRLGDIERR